MWAYPSVIGDLTRLSIKKHNTQVRTHGGNARRTKSAQKIAFPRGGELITYATR